MTEAVEAGAGLAWRLLATLEGGSLLVATSALIAYTAGLKLSRKRQYRVVKTVLVSNARSSLGCELKAKLELSGITVRVPSENTECTSKVDALVVIGAEAESGLDGLSHQVTQDVYENLNLLESLSHSVERGGCIAWVCGRSGGAAGHAGAFTAASEACDAVMRASLQYITKIRHCDGVWINRCATTEQTVDKIMKEFLPNTIAEDTGFSIRNTAHKISIFVGRWLKVIT